MGEGPFNSISIKMKKKLIILVKKKYYDWFRLLLSTIYNIHLAHVLRENLNSVKWSLTIDIQAPSLNGTKKMVVENY